MRNPKKNGNVPSVPEFPEFPEFPSPSSIVRICRFAKIPESEKKVRLANCAMSWFVLLIAAILPSFVVQGCSNGKLPTPVFSQDLRPSGFKTETRHELTSSYCQIAFLTDDIVLVGINQRTIGQPVELSNVDRPPTKLMFFDIRKRALVRSFEMPVEKDSNSVQPLSGARFAIRNESGITICDLDLICGQPIKVSQGPLLASPGGTTFVAGGYGEAEQILFDSITQKELGRFPGGNPVVVPGDGLNLLRYINNHTLFTKRDGQPDQALQSTEALDIFLPDARFISNSIVAVNQSVETLLVVRVGGTSMYRVPVRSWYQDTAVVTSRGGLRFGILEGDFTRWNSITHFYDIEKTRPYDLEKIRVLEVESGKTQFEIKRDPRPYIHRLTLPSLSPDGHHLATIYRGFLEVYEIP